MEVRILEKLQERALAHDVQDHHVDLDRPAAHRSEGDRLLRNDRAEGADVGLVEGPGHEAMDEARLADALFPDEADLELVGLRLRVHRRPSQHRGPNSREGGYQAVGLVFIL